MSTQLFTHIQFNPYATLYKCMGTLRGKQGNLSSITTTTAGGTEIQCTISAGGALWEEISPPVAVAFTLSGTITHNVRAKESVTTANAGLRAKVYRLSGGVETLISTKDFGSPTELTTTDAAKNWTDAAPTSTSIAIGDQIIRRIYAINVGTMAAGSVTITYGGATSAAAGDTFMTLTENVTFQAQPEVVQFLTAFGSSSSAWDTTLVAGNFALVQVNWNASSINCTGVSDGVNTWTSVAAKVIIPTGDAVQWFYAKNVTAGNVTVTPSFSSAPAGVSLILWEFQGVDASSPIEGTPSTGTGTGTSVNGGNVTTTSANTLIFGHTNNDGGVNYTVGASYKALFDDTGTADTFAENLGQTSAGTYAATWTCPSTDWAALTLALKSAFQPAAAGGPVFEGAVVIGAQGVSVNGDMWMEPVGPEGVLIG